MPSGKRQRAKLMIASYSRFCYVYIYIYMSAPYASRCYSCANLILLQLRKLDGCTLRRMVYSSGAALFSGFFCSVAFLPQVFCSQLIGFCCSRHTPSPTLLCTGAMRSGQLFTICIIRRFTLGALHPYKCWITLCWCMKYPSKNILPLLKRRLLTSA